MLLDSSSTLQMWNPRPSLVSLFDAFLPNYAVVDQWLSLALLCGSYQAWTLEKPTVEMEKIHRRSGISGSTSAVAVARGLEEAHPGLEGVDATDLTERWAELWLCVKE